jgi:hypothetical protein
MIKDPPASLMQYVGLIALCNPTSDLYVCTPLLGHSSGAAWQLSLHPLLTPDGCFQGIFHFQLGRGEPMLHTRLRPHCKDFLEKIAKLYELHVFTFGSRLYAHTIAGQSSTVGGVGP